MPPCNDRSQRLNNTRIVVNVVDLAEVRRSPSILCESTLQFHSEALEVLLECDALKKVHLIVKNGSNRPEKADMVLSGLDYCTIVGRLLLLLFLVVPHLLRALKNAGLAGKFDKILTCSFLLSA